MSSVLDMAKWRQSWSDQQRRQRPTGAKFRLTSHGPSVCSSDQIEFTPYMKKLFALSMLTSFAMIGSCQKHDSAAEQQFAQQKTELDAREKALDEREKALAEREKVRLRSPGNPSDLHSRAPVRDPAELKAERERRLQQLPPELKGLIADPSQGRDETDARMQERLAQRQRKTEELQRTRMAHAVKPVEAEATSPTPSPAIDVTSPSPSTTPE